ncbi:Protein GAT2 [Leucoagaricus sp. SymC.cos]|nr:Protein GAT2 [Leucoagaricus sp. SymC.cos]
MDPYHHHLPEIGQTRCYWALLTADLTFIYTDPVLAYHLDTQAGVLIGRSLLAFVHPDEQATAKTDLSGVLESRTLHGSVTRVRLLRLSKVRRNLGHTGPPPAWSDAEKIVIDDKYMAVDLVINWAADGLVLCFIHAAVDLDPKLDNDELNKTRWTNWCGTPYMPPEQIELLFNRLCLYVPQSHILSGRIFQILSNQPYRQLLLSWPPDQGDFPSGKDFAKLVENAEMGSGPQKGSVIFACHKVESSIRSTSTNPTTMHPQISYNSNNGSSYPPPPTSFYNETPPSYPPLTPAYSQGYLTHQPLPAQASSSTYSSPRWSQTQQQNYHQSQPPSAHTHGTSILPTPSSLLSATAPTGPSPSAASLTSISDVVPPPKRRVSPGTTRGAANVAGGNHRYQQPGSATPSSTTTAGRGSGNRPSGILECSSCSATSSPEWRKGPSGKKELCNACGLRYARSRAKKDGGTGSQGRKKKTEISSTISATSATSPGGFKSEVPDLKPNHHHHPPPHVHVVGGNGSSNGIEIKREARHRKRDSLGGGAGASGLTPPLSTIAAASGSPGYTSILRKNFGSGSDYGSPGTSPSTGGGEPHGHAHYAALAAGASAGAGGSEGTGTGTVLTPSPSPPVGAAASTSGSLELHLSGASPSSSSPALSVPAVGSSSGPPISPPSSTSTSTISQSEPSQDAGFVHYHPPPPPHHDRAIPPLSVHPQSHSHTSPHSHPHSHTHPHSPSGSTSSGNHPHSPIPAFSATSHHYIHPAYTARPSPSSQAGNIVTGPAAGPLTPLSSVPPHSASATEAPGGSGNGGSGGGMQLPPLAYMDRLVQGSGSSHGHGHGYGSLGGGVKMDSYGMESEPPGSHSGSGSGSGFVGGSSVEREPLTPLSAESPIGPGMTRSGMRRTILGGGQ